MTPDDMEGRLLHYLSERAKMRQFDGDIHGMNVGDPREAVLTVSDLRALLLDYQERGRVLEPFATWASGFDGDACEYPAPDGTQLRLVPATHPHRDNITVGDLRRARATLKGKSHD